MSKKLFITGTGTDVGKTYITGLFIKKLKEYGKNPAYFKAAMSGNIRDKNGILIPGDALKVKTMANISQPLQEMCPFVYENAVSPHLASRIEGNPVKLSVIEKNFKNVCNQYEYITVEGSGGITCPLCFDEEKLYLDELVKKLNLSSIVVADAGLGTINNVLLTVEHMRAKALPIKGIVFNRFHTGNILEEDNKHMCEYLTGLKVIACVKEGDTNLDLDKKNLLELYEE